MVRNLILLMLIIFISCKTEDKKMIVKKVTTKSLKKTQSINGQGLWLYKDLIKDSIVGLSIERSANQYNNSNNENEIIVAVIDSELNITNDLFANKVWVNKEEIANNNTDDDGNGYIDDIHGWNFLGTYKKDSLATTTHEAVRIIRKYKGLFVKSDSTTIINQKAKEYNKYIRAKKVLKAGLDEAEENIEYFIGFKSRYEKLSDTFSKILKVKTITVEKLDSLNIASQDSILKKKIKSMKYCIKNNIDHTWLDMVISIHRRDKDKVYNVNYLKDRLTEDDPFDINDIHYGNNNIEGTYKIDHATEVSSLILSVFDNTIKHNIKVMPIVVSTYGSEYDKDIALAIRYAVDNGAKIINMSIGKDLASNETWITEAIKYAERNDVLIVSAAGNESLNLDSSDIYYYPNDMDENKIEIANNFIVVGSSNQNNSLVSAYSNYGKKTVDIFAPGEEIKVLTREGTINDSGTSLSAAVVSNIAALIRSLYKNLSASEVKEIIMNSGISCDIMVDKPSTDDEKEPVSFSSLSKSGKIVNAYNALLLAEEVSKKKKK